MSNLEEFAKTVKDRDPRHVEINVRIGLFPRLHDWQEQSVIQITSYRLLTD